MLTSTVDNIYVQDTMPTEKHHCQLEWDALIEIMTSLITAALFLLSWISAYEWMNERMNKCWKLIGKWIIGLFNSKCNETIVWPANNRAAEVSIAPYGHLDLLVFFQDGALRRSEFDDRLRCTVTQFNHWTSLRLCSLLNGPKTIFLLLQTVVDLAAECHIKSKSN